MSSIRFSEFIRERRERILQEWESAVRRLPSARDLDRPALLDHVPDLLERVAEMADVVVAGGQAELPPRPAEQHALERLEGGFDLPEVVGEFAALRDCIVGLWAVEHQTSPLDSAGLRALNHAIDKAVAASIERYTQARERTLQSLDRISTAALEAATLDELLQRLLRVLLETTAAVHNATILLREGDMLVVRATVGFEPEVPTGFSLRIGEGFAGTIAKTKRPVTLRSASTRCLADRTFGMGTFAPSMLRARVVAETGSAAGMMGPVLSRGGGRSPAWPRGSRRSGGRDDVEALARAAFSGSFGTMRGRSFARGASTPWKRVSG